MKRFVAALGLLAACSCSRAPSPGGTVVISPAPTLTVSTPVPAMATSLDPVSKPPSEKMLIGGEVVDLDTMTPHKLAPDPVIAGSIADDTAYLFVRAPGGNELRAFDTTTGRMRWSAPTPQCDFVAASALGVFCATPTGVRFHRRQDGGARTVGTPGIASLLSLGGRVVALHTNKSIDAYDADGNPIGHATAPAMPDHSFAESTLVVAGTLACGAQRMKGATTLFCFDSTPKIIWTRAVPVSGGLVRQADANAIVLASDGESEVVRTSDGTSLLHMNVRLAAAIMTGATLDNVLSVEPDLSFYDARGAKLWTSTMTLHRDALRAVRIGPSIAVAVYSPIATGTQLVGLDASSGAQVWRANVDSLPIGHSEYWNAVDLHLRGKTLVLVGREASQEYVQTFDGSGKRIGSVVRGH